MSSNRLHHSHSMSLGSGLRRPRNVSNTSSSNSSSTDISFGQYITHPALSATATTTTTAALGTEVLTNNAMFPAMPPSPTAAASSEIMAAANGWCASPMVSPATQCLSSRNNFAGSWLDLGSDSEDEYPSSTHHRSHSVGLSLRSSRRKGSSLSSKDPSKNALSGLKELTRRSSMHFRKLTNRTGASS
ncbi:hypothetical protein IWW48_004498 [Coemansia sp. RSA 1200]|nr:hypothetical protein IWW48_004498 [Coemansia sp. RSA 1200]